VGKLQRTFFDMYFNDTKKVLQSCICENK